MQCTVADSLCVSLVIYLLTYTQQYLQFKEKGRDAYRAEDWAAAIEHFSAALAEEKDAPCLALRSSAYQKMGNLDKALEDADSSVALNEEYARGHFRRACIFSAMKDGEQEIKAYEEGLAKCPDDKSLQKGLEIARRVKTASSKASHAANTTMATLEAANSRSIKANSAKDISSFVTQTKWNLQLQMRALQSKLDLVKELGDMTANAKLDFLYNILLEDAGTSTSIALSDFQAALTAASTNLTFSSSVSAALKEVETPTEAASLKREEFQDYCQKLVESMHTNVNDFSEFVVYQVKFGGDAPPAAAAAAVSAVVPAKKKNILNDPRMMALFVMFDKDADSTVDFKEVAIGLYKLSNNMKDSAKNAAALLLMMDKNDERVLTYETFARLIVSVAAASDLTFDELADQLTLALTDKSELSEELMNEIIMVEENLEKIQQAQAEESQRKKTMDALSYSKTLKLFELWDADGDGTIDFQELLRGIRKYLKASNLSSTEAEKDALMIMGHDKDSNQALDKEEFAYAMSNYSESIQKPLHEVIDFMVVVGSKETNKVEEFETNYSNMSTMAYNKPAFKRSSLGIIVDLGEADEEEEDDW
jgi:Ca2+-binding EF-hand superfamily protein/tetratricopeptide (TPR) repeat protein